MVPRRLLYLSLLFPQRQCKLLLHTSLIFNKKYPYDLDSLIEWKRETQQVFGSPRKLTKLGKLKKLRKTDETVRNNVEILSALSNQSKFRSCDSDIQFSADCVEQAAICHTNEEASLKKESDIPDDIFVTQALHLHEIAVSRTSLNRDFILSGERSGGINIPKSSVPEFAVEKSSVKKEHPQHTNLSRSTPALSREPVSVTGGGHDYTLQNEVDERDTGTFVSKIEPISVSKEIAHDSQDFRKSAVPLSLPPERGAVLGQPVEPPESFDIISKFPLTHNQSEDWQEHFNNFKMDVERMSLRVVPSVKTILSKTMPELNRFFLSRWRKKMVNELGEEGFKRHQEATIKKGVNFHANVMDFLSGKPIDKLQIMPDNEGHWSSLQVALSSIGEVCALEMEVVHPVLLYRGVLDCIAQYKDVLCLIDWKTSKQPRPLLKNTYDDPLQVAAYIGAVNANADHLKKFGHANHGMIVVAYPDGSPAHIHMMDRALCEQYWQDWTSRLYLYYQLIFTEKYGNSNPIKK